MTIQLTIEPLYDNVKTIEMYISILTEIVKKRGTKASAFTEDGLLAESEAKSEKKTRKPRKKKEAEIEPTVTVIPQAVPHTEIEVPQI
jgi:hypothetical protein